MTSKSETCFHDVSSSRRTRRRDSTLGAGAAACFVLFGPASAIAEPSARTYPPTACQVASSTQITSRAWSNDITGLRHNARRGNLTIECPVMKDNIGSPLARGFAWVINNNARASLRCSLGSFRMSGENRAFFTTRSATERFEPTQIVFPVDRILDESFPQTGDVVRPSAYSLRCTLPSRDRGPSAMLGYHIEEEQ